MLRLFSLNNFNTDNAGSSNQGPRPSRGRSSVVASSGSFGTPGNYGQTIGRSSIAQEIGGKDTNVLGLPLFTQEPCSNSGTSGGNSGGRCTPAVAATSPASNRVKALAFQQPGIVAPEKAKPDRVLQPTPVCEVEVREDVVAVPHEEVKAPRVYARRRHRRNQSPRFPLQTGTDPPFLSNLANEERFQPSRTSSVNESQVGFPRASKSPLQGTLFNGTRNLFSDPPLPLATSATSTLHVLGVGVAYGNLQDPQHDLNILATLFKDHESGQTRFRGISGDEATLETIEATIGELYQETLKSPGSNLLILLTGEGDKENNMYLMGDVFISDRDLRRWMWKLQVDCYPNNRTVTIILDYCRTNPNVPSGKAHFGVEFIWSCSPGQTAAALSVPNTQNIPRSCFLLSLMMSSYHFANMKSDLIASVNYELRRFLRLLELTHRKIHESGRCNPCNRKEECPMPYLPQTPEWQQAGSMKSVYDFVHRLSMTDIVPKVYNQFINYKYFREANGLAVEGAPFNPTPSGQAGLTRHNRGSSKSVHAAPNILSMMAESSRAGNDCC